MIKRILVHFYIASGLVHAMEVERLMAEKLDTVGLSVPGMP